MENSYTHNKLLQKSLSEWISSSQYSLFVTLIFNSDTIGLSGFKNMLREFHGRVDKELLGSKFHKKTGSERTNFICTVEHLNSNLHGHLLLSPAKNLVSDFKTVSKYVWWKLCRKGEINIKEVYDLKTVSDYMTKECYKEENYNNFILSSELLNSPSV